MLSKKMPGMLVIAGTMIAASLTVAPSAWSASPSSSLSHAEYKPVQSISYDFGSKSMSGYYVQEANSCLVMLMITASDPELAIETSPTRVRLALTPGQIAGLDSQEGRSLNVTCGADAATLIVDTGATERLFARQMPNSQRDLAERD